jgi:hypothetical protein
MWGCSDGQQPTLITTSPRRCGYTSVEVLSTRSMPLEGRASTLGSWVLVPSTHSDTTLTRQLPQGGGPRRDVATDRSTRAFRWEWLGARGFGSSHP